MLTVQYGDSYLRCTITVERGTEDETIPVLEAALTNLDLDNVEVVTDMSRYSSSEELLRIQRSYQDDLIVDVTTTDTHFIYTLGDSYRGGPPEIVLGAIFSLILFHLSKTSARLCGGESQT